MPGEKQEQQEFSFGGPSSSEGSRAEGKGGTQENNSTEEKGGTQENQLTEEEVIKQEAIAKGWKPFEEFDGPKGAFVGAGEFLRREPLFDKIKSQSRQIKELSKSVEAINKSFQSQLEGQVKLRIKALEKQKEQAISIADVNAVKEIDAQIEEEKKTTAPKNSAPPEVDEWIDKNEWFTTNKEMADFAIAHNQSYIKRNPGDIKGALSATEKAIKKAFPEFFGVKPKTETTPNPVNGNQQGKKQDTGKGYNVSRLSPDQKRVYDQQVKRFKILSHDEFFAGLEEIGELQ